MTGADGELARLPALSPKIDNTTVTIAANGVTTAWDTGATADADRAAGVTAVDLAVDATGESADDTAFGEFEDTTVEDTAAFSSGLLDVIEAGDGAAAVTTGADFELATPEDAAVVAGGVEADGVSVDAGAVVPVPSTAAAPVLSVAGGVGAVVVGPTGSKVAGVDVDSKVELPADVVEDGDAGVVDSEPELPAEVVDGVIDLVDSEPDVLAAVVVVDSELELPTVVAEIVEDGEVVLVEVVPAVGDDVARVAGVPSAADLDVLPSLLELLELPDDEPDVAAVLVSAWARPEPLINAAPRPTVNAEFVTHVGTSWVTWARCRPLSDLAALIARAFALARFFTR